MLYESMLLFGIAFGAGLVFSIAGQMRSGMDPLRPYLLALVAIVFGMYFSWCWSKGQTLAMRTWKIRVVDRSGHPPRLMRGLVRYLCSWVWVLPPLALVAQLKPSAPLIAAAVLGWMAFWALLSYTHPQRQFWHDAIAGTRLVNAEG
jgi:uncharacterized RDD family membrane protein YckC